MIFLVGKGIISYYTPAEGVLYLLREIPRGRAVNTILLRIGRIVTGLSPNKRSKSGKSFLES